MTTLRAADHQLLRRSRATFAAGVVAVMIVSLWPTSPASAQVASIGTVLVVDGPSDTLAGESFEVVVRLETTGGTPVSDAGINLVLGTIRERKRTDDTGVATLTVREDLAAGEYEIELTFNGATSRGLAPSRAATTIRITPVSFRVEVVPPVAGVEIALGEERAFTNELGIASFEIASAGDYLLEVPSAAGLSDQRRWVFRRWGSGDPVPSRTIRLPDVGRLQLGIEIQRQVSMSFVDLAGDPALPSAIERVELKNSIGEVISLAPTDVIWARENNISRTTIGLIAPPISYGVSSVLMAGSNVVSRGQQRFFAAEGDAWEVVLLMYDVRFSVRDRIFGTPIGSAVDLTYPDGHTERVALDRQSTVTMRSLPRGDYEISVIAQGLRLTQPVAVSREQNITLKVVSYVDVAVAALVLAVAALGPLVLGRRHRDVLRAWSALRASSDRSARDEKPE